MYGIFIINDLLHALPHTVSLIYHHLLNRLNYLHVLLLDYYLTIYELLMLNLYYYCYCCCYIYCCCYFFISLKA